MFWATKSNCVFSYAILQGLGLQEVACAMVTKITR